MAGHLKNAANSKLGKQALKFLNKSGGLKKEAELEESMVDKMTKEVLARFGCAKRRRLSFLKKMAKRVKKAGKKAAK